MKKILILLFLILPLTLHAQEAENPTSGTCGENCSWKIEGNTLVLNGYGDIASQTPTKQPWYWNERNITKIEIQNQEGTPGFTSIGEHVFEYMSHASEVSLPETMQRIEAEAFNGSGLTKVNIPNSVKEIGFTAFNDNNLTELKIPDSLTNINVHAFSANPIKVLIIPEGITEIHPYAFYCRGCSSTLDGRAMPLEEIYCSTSQIAQCQAAVSHFGDNVKIHEYQKFGNSYYVDGKFYNHANDIWDNNYIKKRIYTVEEAVLVSKPNGNTFRLRYR